ncbi:uncharacterized protein [Spinacia oleracea]|uniref:Replication factor A C-terminal domain-containing protein n=1 Tax=Spinacia oleracea TaxID=3562 RepID=A0ABM3QQ35_SPIOL|nr:uncharacterized protein LOC130461404 [Spinacia oleracea]
MKPERVYLDQLTEKSKGYKVKVKVVEKGPERNSPSKGILFQGLVMEDDKGNRMRAALFGNQIDVYKEAIEHLGSYEIANATIKASDEYWKAKDAKYGLLGYQMSFGSQAVIQRMNAESGPVLPEYQCLATIPRVYDPTDRFDIVAVVLYLEEEARKVTGFEQREYLVREIVVTDHSNEQPITITVWNELTGEHCKPLSSWAEQFTIFGFTALRGSFHKGFSLGSTMSTRIITDPKGERADALREWVKNRTDWLSDRQARVLDVRNPTKEKVIITLDSLKLKRPYNTLQEQRHWLRVTIPNPQMSTINAYLGCSACGRRGDIPAGTSYTCTRCKADTVSTPKITYNFVASDGTGTMECTSFTEDSEKLFRMTAADTFRMKHSNDAATFEQLQEMLKSNHFLLEIGPTMGLSKNGVLEWCLKSIDLESGEAQAENVEHHFADQQAEQGPSASQVLAQATIARQQLEQPTLRRKNPEQAMVTGKQPEQGAIPQKKLKQQLEQPTLRRKNPEQAMVTGKQPEQGAIPQKKLKQEFIAELHAAQGSIARQSDEEEDDSSGK